MQEEKRCDKLEDDCRPALGVERRVRLEDHHVVLVGRRRQAHVVVVEERKGERRRGSP